MFVSNPGIFSMVSEEGSFLWSGFLGLHSLKVHNLLGRLNRSLFVCACHPRFVEDLLMHR